MAVWEEGFCIVQQKIWFYFHLFSYLFFSVGDDSGDALPDAPPVGGLSTSSHSELQQIKVAIRHASLEGIRRKIGIV
jgi:hypothetical protein